MSSISSSIRYSRMMSNICFLESINRSFSKHLLINSFFSFFWITNYSFNIMRLILI